MKEILIAASAILLSFPLAAYGATAEEQLLTAAREGRTTEVEGLLKAGANVEGPPVGDGIGLPERVYAKRSPLVQAAANGHGDVVRLLLDRGAKMQPGGAGTEAAITAAVAGRHMDVVRLLLDRGAEIEARNGSYSTPLLEAAGGSEIEMVRLLIARGAQVNVRNKYKETPLIAAAYAGDAEIARLLLERGAAIEDRARFGETALQTAVCSEINGSITEAGRLAVVKLLLAHRADTSSTDRFGHSALNCEGRKKVSEIAAEVDAAAQRH
ncbi:MAG: ankyrin repeat domain-containing protein [Terracidiphilus sp.]|nr:ankyrin repeat domain-containing protein [Terracidiphilus sp.]